MCAWRVALPMRRPQAILPCASRPTAALAFRDSQPWWAPPCAPRAPSPPPAAPRAAAAPACAPRGTRVPRGPPAAPRCGARLAPTAPAAPGHAPRAPAARSASRRACRRPRAAGCAGTGTRARRGPPWPPRCPAPRERSAPAQARVLHTSLRTGGRATQHALCPPLLPRGRGSPRSSPPPFVHLLTHVVACAFVRARVCVRVCACA